MIWAFCVNRIVLLFFFIQLPLAKCLQAKEKYNQNKIRSRQLDLKQQANKSNIRKPIFAYIDISIFVTHQPGGLDTQ